MNATKQRRLLSLSLSLSPLLLPLPLLLCYKYENSSVFPATAASPLNSAPHANTPPPFLPFTLFYLSRACAFPTLPRPEGLEKPRKARYFDPRVSPICGLNGWFCCIAAYTEGMRFRDSGLRFQLPCGHFFLLGSDVPKFLIRLLLLMIFMPSVGWILRVMCLWMSNSSWAYLFEALTSVILLKFGSYLVFFTLIPVCRRSLLDPGFRALSDPFFFFLIVLAHAGALGSQRARSSMVSLFSCLLSSWSLNKSLLLD